MSRVFTSQIRVGGWRPGWIATVLVWVVAFAGHCPEHPPPTSNPQIASLTVVPYQLTVMPGQEFIARVRGRDQHGALLPDDYLTEVQWSWIESYGLSLTGSGQGSQVRVTPTGISTPVLLTATHVDVTTPASASIFVEAQPPGPPSDFDWIMAPPGSLPHVMFALVDGQSAFDWRDDDVFALAGARPLHRYIPSADPTNSARVAMFSRDWSVVERDMTWKTGCDIVELLGPTPSANVAGCSTDATDLVARTPVNAQVFLLADGVSGRASADIAFAKGVFADLPVGLELSFPITAGDATAIGLTLNVDGTCALDPAVGMLNQLISMGVDANRLKPYGLVIAYVKSITQSVVVDGVTIDLTMSGFSCPADPTFGRVALIAQDHAGVTTLAHELGHALAPAEWGHPDDPQNAAIKAEFDPSNLMWGGELDWSAARRRHLTLGQMFRLTWAKGAFVNMPGAVDCGTDFTKITPCPRLSKDVFPP